MKAYDLATRRTVMRVAIGGVALAGALTFVGVATAQQGGGVSVTELAENVSLVSGAGANVVAVSTDDGLVLVDTGAPGHTDALKQALDALPGGGAVSTVFSTHYHTDQTGGNAAFAADGAKIVAHQKTKQWMSVDYYNRAEDSWIPAREEAAWPTETFYTGGETEIGGEPVEYDRLTMAHTAGDIFVYFPEANVLAAGDAVSPERDPEFDYFTGAWLGGRVDALNRLLEISDENTVIVPSFGAPITRAELQAEADMMQAIWEKAKYAVTHGMSAEDMLENGDLEGLGRDFDDPAKMLYDIHKGMNFHHSAVAHEIV